VRTGLPKKGTVNGQEEQRQRWGEDEATQEAEKGRDGRTKQALTHKKKEAASYP